MYIDKKVDLWYNVCSERRENQKRTHWKGYDFMNNKLTEYALKDLLQCEEKYDGVHELLYKLQAEEIEEKLDATCMELSTFEAAVGKDSPILEDRLHVSGLSEKIEELSQELARIKKECKRYTTRVKKARKVIEL